MVGKIVTGFSLDNLLVISFSSTLVNFSPLNKSLQLFECVAKNCLALSTNGSIIKFNMASDGLGSFQEGELIFQGYSLDSATATATVLQWDSGRHVLTVKDLIGNFVTSNPIYGRKTGATRILESHTLTAEKLVHVEVTPNPPTANANSNYTYTTTITEFPDIE